MLLLMYCILTCFHDIITVSERVSVCTRLSEPQIVRFLSKNPAHNLLFALVYLYCRCIQQLRWSLTLNLYIHLIRKENIYIAKLKRVDF